MRGGPRMEQVSHAGNEHEEIFQIIMNSTQEANNAIPDQD